MNSEISTDREHGATSHWVRRAAVSGAVALSLAGCSEAQTPEPTPLPPATEPQPADPTTPPPPMQSRLPSPEAAQKCSFREVSIGEFFNEDNQANIEKQLDLLVDLQNGNELQLADVVTSTTILRQSLADPLYSQAMVQAVDRIAAGQTVTAEEFLVLPVETPPTCDDRHLSSAAARKQLQEADSAGDFVFDKVSDRFGDQAPVLLQKALERAQEQFEQTVEEYRRQQ